MSLPSTCPEDASDAAPNPSRDPRHRPTAGTHRALWPRAAGGTKGHGSRSPWPPGQGATGPRLCGLTAPASLWRSGSVALARPRPAVLEEAAPHLVLAPSHGGSRVQAEPQRRRGARARLGLAPVRSWMAQGTGFGCGAGQERGHGLVSGCSGAGSAPAATSPPWGRDDDDQNRGEETEARAVLARLCRAAAGSRWRRWLLRCRGGGDVSVHSVSRAGSGCSRGEAWGKRLPPDRPRPRPTLAAGSSFQNARDRGVAAGPYALPAVLAPQPLGPAPWSVPVRVLACVRYTGPPGQLEQGLPVHGTTAVLR